KYSRKQRLNVRYVVMDMNAHYGSWIKQVFPNAEIVTDRFHIVQHINRTFNQLRCQIMKKYLNQSDST
ncbi:MULTISPECIES: transposase, partial [unclassified Granulicatella]